MASLHVSWGKTSATIRTDVAIADVEPIQLNALIQDLWEAVLRQIIRGGRTNGVGGRQVGVSVYCTIWQNEVVRR